MLPYRSRTGAIALFVFRRDGARMSMFTCMKTSWKCKEDDARICTLEFSAIVWSVAKPSTALARLADVCP